MTGCVQPHAWGGAFGVRDAPSHRFRCLVRSIATPRPAHRRAGCVALPKLHEIEQRFFLFAFIRVIHGLNFGCGGAALGDRKLIRASGKGCGGKADLRPLIACPRKSLSNQNSSPKKRTRRRRARILLSLSKVSTCHMLGFWLYCPFPRIAGRVGVQARSHQKILLSASQNRHSTQGKFAVPTADLLQPRPDFSVVNI